MDNLGNKLMSECASWILEAASGERSWLNSSAADKGGVCILLSNKYARLVMDKIRKFIGYFMMIDYYG